MKTYGCFPFCTKTSQASIYIADGGGCCIVVPAFCGKKRRGGGWNTGYDAKVISPRDEAVEAQGGQAPSAGREAS